MARTYKRDGNGRFAGGGGSSGGGGGKRPAAKSVSRGVNRLTRDNAGKITSVGGTGATARGGRLKTAAGNKRAMQTAKVSGSRPAGTMKGKIKRDPGAAGKIGQAKPAAKPRVSKLGSRIDPAKQANRKATAAVDRAMATERKSMNAAMRTKGEFSSPARQSANKRLDDAQRETASLIQTRRNIRAQFPVTTANKPIRAARPKSTISSKTVGASAKNARVSRAKSNLAAAENRRSYTGKNLARSKRTAKKALEFMSNPRSAIQNRSLGLGFRMPKTGKPKSAAKPAVALSKKPTSKAGTATSDIAARRARANTPKTSMYLSQKLNTQSAITRSAANAIYNEQRSTLRMQKSKQASPDVIKSGLIGRGLSGSKRDRAMANREAARKRFVGGRRR